MAPSICVIALRTVSRGHCACGSPRTAWCDASGSIRRLEADCLREIRGDGSDLGEQFPFQCPGLDPVADRKERDLIPDVDRERRAQDIRLQREQLIVGTGLRK